MPKLTFYLPKEWLEALDKLAEEWDMPRSAIVREAVDALIKKTLYGTYTQVVYVQKEDDMPEELEKMIIPGRPVTYRKWARKKKIKLAR